MKGGNSQQDEHMHDESNAPTEAVCRIASYGAQIKLTDPKWKTERGEGGEVGKKIPSHSHPATISVKAEGAT